ncbi:hypothetical protein AQI95_24760 [Streptomyces yokosukanensis]|uniref:Uncharacterized protein n=1 Tax=Streptomyces yokosukanensis TaxID=67386 RepID=A0A101P1G6_9ACTN|nr:hypothetical protein [Streptomyces yokosukanensis]KUN03171.1 hypothetical protein AQI95_24760 [Streptomyces yokosukanensis]
MTDPFNDLSPRARWFMENFDVFGLADICASQETAKEQLSKELADLRAVARGYCPACGRGDAAPTVADWEQQRDKAARLEIANRALNTAAVEAVERAERAEAALRELCATLYPITRTSDPTPLGYQAIHPITPADYQRWTAVLEGNHPA